MGQAHGQAAGRQLGRALKGGCSNEDWSARLTKVNQTREYTPSVKQDRYAIRGCSSYG